jgi:hypothetical protein
MGWPPSWHLVCCVELHRMHVALPCCGYMNTRGRHSPVMWTPCKRLCVPLAPIMFHLSACT